MLPNHKKLAPVYSNIPFLTSIDRVYPYVRRYALDININEWCGEIVQDEGVWIYKLSAPNDKKLVLSITGLKDFDFTFDQDNNVVVCYINELDETYIVHNDVTVHLPNYKYTKVCLDDVRPSNIHSDVIVFGLIGNELVCRFQEDEYEFDYTLLKHNSLLNQRINKVGMNLQYAFQIDLQDKEDL